MTSERGAHDATSTNEESATVDERGSWTTGTPSTVASAKTSAVAVFALVCGLIAFISALTGALAPLAIVFGIAGIVLGVLGRKKGAQAQLTGKSVATGGLVLAIIALLVGLAVAVGAVTVLVNPGLLDPVQQWFSSLVPQLPGR